MDEERWQALVRRLEPQARARPESYRRKVVLLAALGYGFIATLLLVLIGLGVLVVVLALNSSGIVLKFLIPIGALFFVILRSLYVKVEPPEGVRLKRGQAPELFTMIDEVRERIHGPRVHDVLIDGDTNASVVQVPRLLGLFGSRNYLVLGLPYLSALSAEEMRRRRARAWAPLTEARPLWRIRLPGARDVVQPARRARAAAVAVDRPRSPLLRLVRPLLQRLHAAARPGARVRG
jgi:hypothetical protein